MSLMSFCAKPSREREHLGWLEDYWTTDGRESHYAGYRAVPELAQAIGSENRREFVLTEPIKIDRSFDRKRTLNVGTLVRRMVSPLQGRQI